MPNKAIKDSPTHFVEIWIDGSCQGNPGHGGWAVIMRDGSKSTNQNGYMPATTNNRMELTALINAMRMVNTVRKIIIYSDSKYLINGSTIWLKNWQKNNWLKADKKPVLNVDLWKIIANLLHLHDITWCWVKAHADNELNNRCDKLAKQAILDNLD